MYAVCSRRAKNNGLERSARRDCRETTDHRDSEQTYPKSMCAGKPEMLPAVLVVDRTSLKHRGHRDHRVSHPIATASRHDQSALAWADDRGERTTKELEDESFDAVLQFCDVEIDQQSCLDSCQLDVSQQLSLVNAFDLIDALQFDNQFVVDQQVKPIATVQANAFVLN